MKWRRSSQSQVEDRRGVDSSGGLGGLGGLGGGGGIPIPIPGGRAGAGGLGGIILILVLVVGSQLLGGSGAGGLGDLLNQFGVQAPAAQPGSTFIAEGDDQAQFVNAVTNDVQAFWQDAFQGAGKAYDPTVTVVFSDFTQTDGCGSASSATGPFYCPADEKVYLDLGFFQELSDRFGAPGEFAQAYVIAHEYGHHVQNQLGISRAVRDQESANPDQANALSVKLELQADCFAGVWGHSANERKILEVGDLETALNAAAAIGDDRLEKQAGVEVNAETWTHGSSEMRMRWFKRGFETGRFDQCDTFSAPSL